MLTLLESFVCLIIDTGFRRDINVLIVFINNEKDIERLCTWDNNNCLVILGFVGDRVDSK